MKMPRLATAVSGAMLLACSGAPAATTTPAPEPQAARYSPIVELRQYTLRPGRRDELMTMFDSAFVEPQEAVGATIIGQFRNLDDPNKFVWLRGFPTMESRMRSLAQFYGGDAWRSRRSAANATIIDNDNVLLLRPVRPDASFPLGSEPRSAIVSTEPGRGLVIATVYHLDPTDEKEKEFTQFFEQTVSPVLASAGAPPIASFVHERSANGFPGLPVREGEHVFVWFTRFPSERAYERYQSTLARLPLWRDSVSVELSSRVREPYVLRLSPTTRSRLHG